MVNQVKRLPVNTVKKILENLHKVSLNMDPWVQSLRKVNQDMDLGIQEFEYDKSVKLLQLSNRKMTLGKKWKVLALKWKGCNGVEIRS
jgi:hypothetical protein